MTIQKGSLRRREPNNQWFRNVAKSLGYTSTELVTNLAPSTASLIESNASFISNAASELRQINSNGTSRITDALNIGAQVDIAKEALRNAKEDLQTGNLYNKARKDKLVSDMSGFDGDGGDFGLVDIDIDDNFDNGDTGVVTDETGTAKVIIPKVNVNVVPPSFSANNPMVKSLNRQTDVTVKTAKAQMEQQDRIASTNFAVSYKFQSNILDTSRGINDNLGLLVQFQNDSMSKYIGASLKYYEENLKMMETTAAQMKRFYPEPTEQRKERENPMDNVLAGGTFSASGYMQELKKNFQTQFETNPILTSLKMVFDDKDTLRHLAQSPLSFISTKIVTTLIPKFFQESIGALDRSIENFFPALMAKMSSWRENDNPFLRTLGELFGVRNMKKTRPDLSRYERGAVPFDGETKVAITEVIPGYLRKILAAVGGGEDMAFDYKQRKFRTAYDMKKEYDQDVRRHATNSYGDSLNRVMENASAFQFKDERERQKFSEGVKQFFESMTRKGSFVNPELRKDKNGRVVDDIKNTFTFDDDSLDRLLRQSIMGMSKGERIKLFGSDYLNATQDLRRYMEELEKNPQNGNAQIIHDGLGLGKNPSDKKDKPTIGKPSFGADVYGKTPTDYLRDLKSILLQGIKVFPMGGFNGGNAHRNVRGEYTETLAGHKAQLEKMSGEESRYKKSQQETTRSREYSDQELTRMLRQGQISVDSVDLLDISDSDMQSQIQERLRQIQDKDKAEQKGVGQWMMKYLSGSKQERANAMREQIDRMLKKPAELFRGVLNQVDNTMYSIVFGHQGDGSKASFFNRVLTGIDTNFKKIGTWMETKVFNPVKEFFTGENGVLKRISGWDKFKEVKGYAQWTSTKLLGEKDIHGVRRNGLLGDTGNEISDIGAAFRYMITGKEYKDRHGNKFDKNPNSMFAEMGKVFGSVRKDLKHYLVGDKNATDEDNKRGLLTGVGTAIGDGFNTWREALFGPKEMKGGQVEKRSFKEMMGIMRKRAPKTLAWGALGTGAGLMVGGTGLLGSFLLPGGPLGAAVLGSALGFATQSESFNNYVFGEKDFDGNRLGGIIGVKTQEFFKKNKAAMVGGATVGMLKPLLGLGLIPSFLLPGGPIGGALFGIGTAMLYRSEAVQKTLFGEKDFEGKRMGGILAKTFGKHKTGKSVLGNIGVGALGGAGLAAAIGQFGLMGAMLTPAGPIGGAILGAAAGIALSSDKWKHALFGTWNIETGTREGGALGKALNMMQVNIKEPMLQSVKEMSFGVRKWFTTKVANPLEDAIAPLKQMFKNMRDDFFEFTTNGFKNIRAGFEFVGKGIGNQVTKFLESDAIAPLVTYVKHYITGPLTSALTKATSAIVSGLVSLPGKITRGLLTGIGKFAGGLATMPIKALSAFSHGVLDISHRSRGRRKGREREREHLEAQREAGYNVGWFNTKDAEGRDTGEGGRWGSFKRRWHDSGTIEAAEYSSEGAGYQIKERARRKKRDDAQSEKFDAEEAALKESREKVKALKRFGRRYNYDNVTENGVDISRFYKISKSGRKFKQVMQNEDSRNIFERTLEKQLGVSGKEIFGEDYDPANITKKQRKLIQSAISKKRRGLNFDIRQHFGLGAKAETDLPTTGIEGVGEQISKMATSVTSMGESVTQAIHGASAKEAITSALIPNSTKQVTFLEAISNNVEKFLNYKGKKPELATEAESLKPKPIPTPRTDVAHHDNVMNTHHTVEEFGSNAMRQLISGMTHILHSGKAILVKWENHQAPPHGNTTQSAPQPESTPAHQPAETGGMGMSGGPKQGGGTRHGHSSAANMSGLGHTRGAWNRFQNFRRNGGVVGSVGRMVGRVQNGISWLGNTGTRARNTMSQIGGSVRSQGILGSITAGVKGFGLNMANRFNLQRNAVIGGRSSYMQPEHAGGSDMYRNPQESGLPLPSAGIGGVSSAIGGTALGLSTPLTNLVMNESIRRADFMPGELDDKLQARQAFTRRRTGEYEIEQHRIRQERAAMTSFRESLMAHSNNIDLTTYEILELLRNWPHNFGKDLPIPPVVPVIGGGGGKDDKKKPEDEEKKVTDDDGKTAQRDPVKQVVPDDTRVPVKVIIPDGVTPVPDDKVPSLNWGWDRDQSVNLVDDPSTNPAGNRSWNPAGATAGGRLGRWVGNTARGLGGAVRTGARGINNWVGNTAGKVGNALRTGTRNIGQWVGNTGKSVGGAVRTGARGIAQWVGNTGKTIGGAIRTGQRNIGNVARRAGEWGRKALDSVNDMFAPRWSPVPAFGAPETPKTRTSRIKDFLAQQFKLDSTDFKADVQRIRETGGKVYNSVKQPIVRTLIGGRNILKGAAEGLDDTLFGSREKIKTVLSQARGGVSRAGELIGKGVRSVGSKVKTSASNAGARVANFGQNAKQMFTGNGERFGRLKGVRNVLGSVGRTALKVAAPVVGAYQGNRFYKNAEDIYGTKNPTKAQKTIAALTGFAYGATPIGLAELANPSLKDKEFDLAKEVYSLKNPKEWWSTYGKKAITGVFDQPDKDARRQGLLSQGWNWATNNPTGKKLNSWLGTNVRDNYNSAQSAIGNYLSTRTLPGQAFNFAKDKLFTAETGAKIKSGGKTAWNALKDTGSTLKQMGGQVWNTFFGSKKASASGPDDGVPVLKKDKYGNAIAGVYVDSKGNEYKKEGGKFVLTKKGNGAASKTSFMDKLSGAGKSDAHPASAKKSLDDLLKKDDFTKTATEKAKTTWDALTKKVEGGWGTISSTVGTATKDLGSKTKKTWEGLKTGTSEKWDGIKTSVTDNAKLLGDKTSKVWGDVKKDTSEKWDNVKTSITDSLKSTKAKATKVWGDVKKDASEKWDSMKTSVTSSLKDSKAKASKIWGDVKKDASEKWGDIKTSVTSSLKDSKTKAAKVWGDVKKDASEKWGDIKTSVTSSLKDSKAKAEKIWGDVKKDASEKWGNIKSSVGNSLKDSKAKAEKIWGDISRDTSEKWNSVKKTLTTQVGKVKSATEAMGSNLKGMWEGASTQAKKTWDSMKKNIPKKATELYDNVFGIFSSAIGSVKDFGTNISKKVKKAFEKLFGGGIHASDKERKAQYGGGNARPVLPAIGGGDAASDPTSMGAGDTPFYSQRDAKWGNMNYGGASKVKDIGCAPTSAAMVMSKLTGKTITPKETAQQALKTGYVDSRLGTHKDYFKAVGQQYGVNMTETSNTSDVLQKLAVNKPVVLRGEGGGPFTKGGHYLVATGVTKDGKVTVNDPLKNTPTKVAAKELFKRTTTSFVPTAPKSSYGAGNEGSFVVNEDKLKPPVNAIRKTSSFEFGRGKTPTAVNVPDARHYGAGYRKGTGVMSDSLVTSEYRSTSNPTTPKNYHTGIDLVDIKGNKTRPIKAFTNGQVVSAGMAGAWGNLVIITDEHGYKHYYSHLSRVSVKKGQNIKKGSVIGNQGTTGVSTGPHLHYEVVRPGTTHGQATSDINPEDYANKYKPDKSFIGTLIEGGQNLVQSVTDVLGKVKDSAMGIFDFMMGAEELAPIKLIGDMGLAFSQTLIKGLTPGWVGDKALSNVGNVGSNNVDTSSYIPGNLKNTSVGKLASTEIDKYVKMNAKDIDAWIGSKAPSNSVMRGLGKDFVQAGEKYNIDPRMLVALAAQESGWGTSRIARERGNLFGWKAYDSSPYASSQQFSKAGGSVHHVADRLRNLYINQWNLDTLAEMNTKYSTSKDWAVNIARIMQGAPKTHGAGMVLGIGGGDDTPIKDLVPESFGRGMVTLSGKKPTMYGAGVSSEIKVDAIRRGLEAERQKRESTITKPVRSSSSTTTQQVKPMQIRRDDNTTIPVPKEGLVIQALDMMSQMVVSLREIADNTRESTSHLDAIKSVAASTPASTQPTVKPNTSKPHNSNPIVQAATKPAPKQSDARAQKDYSMAKRIAAGRL